MPDSHQDAALRFFADALATHKRGDLVRAEALYVQALQADPKHADALHFLGFLHGQKGNTDAAVRLISESVAIAPNASAHWHLADSLQALGRLPEAIVHYDRALALNGDLEAAWLGRGTALQDLGRLDEALASYDNALRQAPNSVGALCEKGNALRQMGRPDDALPCYEKAVALQPNHPALQFNLAGLLNDLQCYEAAVAAFDHALTIEPRYADAWLGRGTALQNLKKPVEALTAYDQALALDPNHLAALYNRGIVLAQLGKPLEALQAYDAVLRREPNHAEAQYNRGNVLHDLNRLDQAVAAFDRALAIRPNYTDAHYNRGIALYDMKRWEDAVASFDAAIAADPNHGSAWHNRGIALHDLGRVDDALASYDRAQLVNPIAGESAGYAFNIVAYLCDWPERERRGADLVRRALEGQRVEPFNMIAAGDNPQAQYEAARKFVAYGVPAQSPLPRKPRPPSDKIRLCYLSGDFHDHPVAQLTAPLFEHHDRDRFELIALSSGPNDGSSMHARMQKAFERFYDVVPASNAQVAQIIQDLNVDIAVDLSGFTKGARIGALAYRPAPLAVNMLGFPGTTGASYIDYIIADPHLISPEMQGFFTEKPVYLPDTYMPNHRERLIGTTPSRAEVGLPPQGFVFCCFNGSFKFAREVFEIWLRLLHTVPGSVLWFNFNYDRAAENLRHFAQSQGIAAERLVFSKTRLSAEDHLARLQHADVFLDTRPYNAHATAADILWAGVPVITCPGKAFAARVAGSLVSAAGLPEFVCSSLADYEALALRCARDAEFLRAAKDKLVLGRATSALFDVERYTRNLENAYVTMWERLQKGMPPERISIV